MQRHSVCIQTDVQIDRAPTDHKNLPCALKNDIVLLNVCYGSEEDF